MGRMKIDRRTFLQVGGAAGLAGFGAGQVHAQADLERYQDGASQWPICLNTSTIRPAALTEKVRIADEVGYDGIELWINDLEKYEQEGGDLKELGAEIRDRGLFVPNVIGLWDGMPGTQEEWDASLPKSRERMRMSRDVGSRCIAALPFPDREDFDIRWGTYRYRDLLRMGRDEYGLRVIMEFIGFLKGVNRLGQACAMAIDSNEPTAAVLPDTFHLYRGGSGFRGIRHLAPEFIADFHWNDVPATPGQFELRDRDRIFPGDGILPLKECLRDLAAIGYAGPLSLELFNEEHWKMDPKIVAEQGLQKMIVNVAGTFG
jgi:sugar phosphate isomerase/epimerase